jgi:hypothetical protein
MDRRSGLEVDGRLPRAFWIVVGLKVLLVLLLMLPLFLPDLEQYDGKGMSWRLLVYPLAGIIIPLLWRLTGSRPPYPYLADGLVILPAISDVIWNTLDAYDRVDRWDDANHLVNAMIFSAVIGLWAARYPLGATVRYLLALGVGMTLQALWEIGEYMVFVANAKDDPGVYQDTIGDLALDLVGSLAGAAFAIWAATSEDRAMDLEPAPGFFDR